jgi:hypothetical protein
MDDTAMAMHRLAFQVVLIQAPKVEGRLKYEYEYKYISYLMRVT